MTLTKLSTAVAASLLLAGTAYAENTFRWTSSGDAFNLRKDVTFHDGSAFTAEDVVFSFERARDEASDFKEQIKNVLEVQVIDDHTVKLMTDGPNPILPNQLTSLFMIDKTWAEANNVVKPQDFAGGEENYAVRNVNGTGPFMLESRAPDELTVLKRNPNWWGNDHWVSRPSRRSAPSSSAWTRALMNCVPRA